MDVKLTATISISFDPADLEDTENVSDTLGGLLTELKRRGVDTHVLSPDTVPDGPDDDDSDPMVSTGAQDKREAPQAQAPAKRVRDRTAERRAAKEKAEAEARAKAPAQAQPDADPDDPLLGAGAGNAGGDPFGDDPLPPGPDPKPKSSDPEDRVRTPKQCMDGSIVILRQCFAVPGGADAVKALQKTYKISKFIDLPMDSAPGLWKDAVALAGKLNVTIPAGV